jgi:hypothetical protein
MEKNTVTIEIKQEVSITLLWIVGGVIVVSLVFLLTPPSMELWPSVNAAGIAAAVYLLAMLMYALRKPVETKVRIWIGLAAIVVLALGAFTWVRMENETRWQAETIMKIRGVIGRGVMRYELKSTAALKTLDEFYRPRGARKESLADVFRRLYTGAEVGANIHKPEWETDQGQVIVAKLEPAIIELVSQETYVKGRNPEFKNYNGQVGMIQEKVILTEKGITYVSEN